MKNKYLWLIIVLFILLGVILSFKFLSAYNYQVTHNPWTGKLDYHVTANFSNYTVISDLFKGNGSLLNVNSSNYWDDKDVPSDLNYLILSDWENITNKHSSDFNYDILVKEANITDLDHFTNVDIVWSNGNYKIKLKQQNITNENWLEDSEEGNLNVNSSMYADKLDGEDGSYYLDDTTIGNCSGDGSCSLITYDSELDYTTDTNASTACSGSDYLAGDGTCNADTDTQLSTENVQDYIYNSVLTGIQTHISVNYDDANNEVDYVVSDDWWDANADISADEISEGKVGFSTACGAGNHLYISGNDLACESDDDTTYSGGDAITITGTTIDFDGGTSPGGELGGTWASPTVDSGIHDDEYIELGDSFSGDISGTYNSLSIDSGVVSDSEVSSLSWNELNNYPNACPANTYVTNISDSITCTGISDNWLNEGGDTATGKLNVNADFEVDTTNHDLFVDDSAGKVGIGTNSPQKNFHVSDSRADLLSAHEGNMYGGDVLGSLLFYNDDPSTSGTGRRIAGGVRLTAIDQYGRSRLEFTSGTSDPITGYGDSPSYVDNSTPRMVIDYTGEVGIGTTDPGAELEVEGHDTVESWLNLDNHADYYFKTELNYNAADTLNFIGPYSKNFLQYDSSGKETTLGPSDAVRTIINGDVGIGTTSFPNSQKVSISEDAGYAIMGVNSSDQRLWGIYNDNSADDKSAALIFFDANSDSSVTRIEGRSGRDSFINNGGNVGIGTTGPGSKLEVQDSSSDIAVFDSSSVNGGYIKISESGTTSGLIGSQPALSGSSGSTDVLTIRGGNGIDFHGSGTGIGDLFINGTSGNVGIGTTSPDEELDIEGTDAGIDLQSSAGSNYRAKIRANYDYSHPFTLTGYNGAEIIGQYSGNDYVSFPNGNVGIGTASPAQLLDVGVGNSDWNYVDDASLFKYGVVLARAQDPAYASSFVTARRSRGSIVSPTTVATDDALLTILSQAYNGTEFKEAGRIGMDADTVLGGNVAGRWVFSTTDTSGNKDQERMTILPDGNVGIGTTSPGKKLEVSDDILAHDKYYVGKENATAGGRFEWYQNDLYFIDSTEGGDMFFHTTPSGGNDIDRMIIKAGGNIGIGATNPQTKLDVHGAISSSDDGIITLQTG